MEFVCLAGRLFAALPVCVWQKRVARVIVRSNLGPQCVRQTPIGVGSVSNFAAANCLQQTSFIRR